MDTTTSGADEPDVYAHTPENQPPPFEGGVDLYVTDRALQDALARHGASWADATLRDFSRTLSHPDVWRQGRDANAYPPTLHAFDAQGRRADRVEFHPAYHGLMTLGMRAGLHASPWAAPRAGAHVARAAAVLLYGQVEAGTQCPLTMTYASMPVLARFAAQVPTLAADWRPRLLSTTYDPRFAPVTEKRGATVGMGMTEKQGGSDVRANVTRATPVGAREVGAPYRLHGHKWFMSAPMSDAFLVLAQASAGVSCFFVPRFVDGAPNAIRLQRLKDKLGNRSNASSEAEFHGATGLLLGDEGRGVATILEMVNYTRLDCALGSAAVMRQALARALHHAVHRRAFGKPLVEHALMRTVLADLALESEAATALALRLAQAYDGETAHDAAWRRIVTPVAKFWICKRLAAFVQEAMEVLGGNGYVEESILPRLYREAPLNSIWEGAGNLMCLDLLRALGPAETRDALRDELASVRGADARLDAFAARLQEDLAHPSQADARDLARRVALAVQAAVLVRGTDVAVADGFCASRLAESPGAAFGMLPSGIDVDAIVARAMPRQAA